MKCVGPVALCFLIPLGYAFRLSSEERFIWCLPRGVIFRFQIDFDDADEEEADELQEEEEAHEEGETDVEINVTDKMESTEQRTEEPSLQVAGAENGNDVTPETEVEPIETDKKDEKEKADVEMKEEERADERNVMEETRNTEVIEKSEEGEGKKVTVFFGRNAYYEIKKALHVQLLRYVQIKFKNGTEVLKFFFNFSGGMTYSVL